MGRGGMVGLGLIPMVVLGLISMVVLGLISMVALVFGGFAWCFQRWHCDVVVIGCVVDGGSMGGDWNFLGGSVGCCVVDCWVEFLC